ncbi:hypothetical protein B0O99DRAFT_654341 [Bisporella sp. PMI_857]|nr:hypothetical protein B0O99DRAFT_654341 [Bisporella sp. PMI_857]
MSSSYYTVGGYLVLILAGGVIYYSSTKKGGKRAQLNAAELRREKARKAREEGAQTVTEKDSKVTEKPKKKPKAKAPEPDSEPQWLSNDTSSDKVDDAEFARQISGVQTGTTLRQAPKIGGRQKSVKQSRAQEKPIASASSDTAPSSNAGGDADDDQSPINSPVLGATDDRSPVTGGDISDMLEAPTAGPSILRVTSPKDSAPTKKQKTPAAPAPTETKKQRQNRKKKEEQSALRLEAEKERKKLEEKQRRTAREAEGRAAKDGSTFVPTNAPSSSVWSSEATTNGTSTPKPHVELLDTYETPSNSSKAGGDITPDSEHTGDWQKLASTLPSEEEQIRQAIEDSDNWETVQTQKRKKKTRPAPGEDAQEAKEKEIFLISVLRKMRLHPPHAHRMMSGRSENVADVDVQIGAKSNTTWPSRFSKHSIMMDIF